MGRGKARYLYLADDVDKRLQAEKNVRKAVSEWQDRTENQSAASLSRIEREAADCRIKLCAGSSRGDCYNRATAPVFRLIGKQGVGLHGFVHLLAYFGDYLFVFGVVEHLFYQFGN